MYHITAQDRVQMIYNNVVLASINEFVPVHINDWYNFLIFFI